ncbi:MAG: DUF357 domain-containing protein [Candidatus Pacearchaeota archaeon]|nr:MAG: DUF357 domain-containing protein [Candidatus Pacearchaeota archaeon]
MKEKKIRKIKKIEKINLVCKSHLKKYFRLTSKALKIAKKAMNKKKKKEALVVIDMAQRYYDDAKYFESKGHMVNAFAALNYAHGWLDCGSRLGFFRVKDSKLFVVK